MDPETLAMLFNPSLTGPMSGGYAPYAQPTPTIFPWLGNSGAQQPPTQEPSGTPEGPSGAPLSEPQNIQRPMSIAPPAPGPSATPDALAARAQGTTDSANRLLATLRGVQAPAAPVAQKVGTPHPPQMRPIQGGGLVNLLASLGIGPRDVYQTPRIQLPGMR